MNRSVEPAVLRAAGLLLSLALVVGLAAAGNIGSTRPGRDVPGGRGAPAGEGDYVLLLHGLGRTALSMSKMERVLSSRGYRVINFNYPSRREDVESLTWRLKDLLDGIHPGGGGRCTSSPTPWGDF